MTEKLIAFKLFFSKRQMILFIAGLLLCVPSFIGSETLMVRTFYPPPFGPFAYLKVSPGGNVGNTIAVGPSGAKLYLGMQTNDTTNSGLDVYGVWNQNTGTYADMAVTTTAGKLVLGSVYGTTFNGPVKNFCIWSAYATLAARTCPAKTTLVAIGTGCSCVGSICSGCTIDYSTYASASGYMLCCKFTAESI